MHVLDLIMYFVTVILLWLTMHLLSGGEMTEELGGALIGFPVIVIYTIIYIAIFVWPGNYNWVDIFHNGIKTNFNLKW